MISWAFSLSRSPVGSSAHTIAGSFTSARAIVHALALAAGELLRDVRRPLAEADHLERGHRPARAPGPPGRALTSSGSSTFSTALRTGIRL